MEPEVKDYKLCKEPEKQPVKWLTELAVKDCRHCKKQAWQEAKWASKQVRLV
jgi:hypothetical protein